MSNTTKEVQRASFQDDRLAVRITERDDALFLELTDKTAKRTWTSPLLALEVHHKAERADWRLEKYRIDLVQEGDGGVHVVVGDRETGIDVGLWFRLRNGELSVLLSPPEIYERKPLRYVLFGVDLMPDLMRVGTDGTWLLPISGGVACNTVNKPALADQFLIYLEQPRWRLSTMLPFLAVHDPRGGWMALATQGAADAQCRVRTDGKGTGWTGFAFSLRRHWPDPVDPINREFRFLPIPADAEPVLFTAKRLRRHVMEDLGKPTVEQRAKESPEIAYQLSACVVKLFHGMENEGAAMSEIEGGRNVSYQNVMTFAETKNVLRKLRDVGLPRLYTQSVGWNARGHDGMYPTRFPIDERLGGESGFRDLLQYGHNLGYQMNVHDNFQMNIRNTPGWDPECVIHDMYGEPLMRGWWAGGIEYGTWYSALPPKRLAGHMQRVKDLGVRGMYYCDYQFAPLEVNYHPRHRGGRNKHLEGQVHLFAEAKRIFGSVGTEFGALPGMVACDNVTSSGVLGYFRGCDPRWPVSGLFADGKCLPMLALTMQGLTIMQANGGPTWSNAMQAVAYGLLPRDEFGVRPIKMGGINVFDERRAHALKALHDVCIERFGHLIRQEITRCNLPDEQTVETTFADGTEVLADFKKQELTVNGKQIARPTQLLP